MIQFISGLISMIIIAFLFIKAKGFIIKQSLRSAAHLNVFKKSEKIF